MPKDKATLSLIMNENGGVVDDCIMTRISDTEFFIVLNAGRKHKDLEHLHKYKSQFEHLDIEYNEEKSLISI